MFYKVAQSGSIFITALFFDPETKEVRNEVVRDYDYADGSRDNDELYYMPIDEEVKKLYLRHIGIISVGDTIEVVKGRKVPIGTIADVIDIRDWKDQYGRVQTRYAYLSNGQKTNITNCKIV